MDNKINILIVEDEMIIAANISLILSNLGYEVMGLVPRGEEALVLLKENTPDIVLMDINLKGTIDGVETVRQMQQFCDVPVIYLTANNDEESFNRAKETHPFAFIAKPFKKLDLQRTIELLISQKKSAIKIDDTTSEIPTTPYVLDDCIFVRHLNNMVKVAIKKIFYIEAERNYCRIFTQAKEYVLVITLKDIEKKLPSKHFMRIHRSFIINLSQINELGSTHVVISKKMIPISKPYKEQLLQRLNTI
ncbi:LytR/AlgR family response regulator transcription factor [Patiriisocius marinus]|uniref:LytR/AlgR family response regulator transcription factor n=1 Tax=Patiriisocius marinus TaxID=1397112 RepID=UPI00232F91CE|nr:response regulator [Patiriisocius marinus]